MALPAVAALVTLAASCGGGAPQGPPAATGGEPRHVFLIVVDTLRADHLGYHGHDRPTSPFLDRLSRESAVFDAAYSASSNTLESVFALLSSTHGLNGNLYSEGVPADSISLQKMFRIGGFDTLAVIANPWLKVHAEFFSDGFRRTTFVNQEHGEQWGANTTADVTSAVVDYLDHELDPDGRTFFYIHYLDPHDIYLPPEDYGFWKGPAPQPRPFAHPLSREDEIHRALERDPEFVGKPRPHPAAADSVEFLRAAYDGEIRHVDAHLELLVGKLRSMGILDDSVIVVTADHGEEFLDHGLLKHGFHLYDETVHVPLLIHGPAFVRPGRQSAPVSGIDLVPTLLTLSGITPAPSMLGRNLLESREGEPVLFSSHFLNQELRGMRWGRWKVIEDRREGTLELYDLDTDPGERSPLDPQGVPDGPGILERYSAEMDRHTGPADGRRLDPPEMDEETRRQLESLGYVD